MTREPSSERLLVATARAAALLQRSSISEVATELLREIGEATGVDRAYVFECHPHSASGEPAVSQRFEWVASGIEPQIANPDLQDVPIREAGFARWLERMRWGAPIHGAVRDFPESEQEPLRLQGIRSLLAVPVLDQGGLQGFVGFDACRTERQWNEAERAALAAIAAAIGAALDRQRAQREARAARQELEEEARVSQDIASFARETIASLRDPELPDRVCRRVAELLGCDAAFAAVLSDADQTIAVRASYGLDPQAREMLALIRASREQAERFAANLANDDVVVAEGPAPEFAGWGLNSCVTWRIRLALRREGELIGVLSAVRQGRSEGFRASDLRLARGLAQVASLAFESVRLLASIEEASRLEDRFVATMSHELRTPLNVVIGYLDMLDETGGGSLSEAQRRVVLRARQAALMLADIVAEGFEPRGAQGPEEALRVVDFELEPIVARAVGVFRERIQEKSLLVRIEVAPDAARLHSDPTKVDVILRNLVGNAVKFTPEGRIEVRARRGEGGVEIEVRDTGIGIDPKLLAEIFAPYRQISRTAGGVGLGLHVVARLVDLIGGRVEVESALGMGSLFRIFVPDLAPTPRRS